MLSVRATICESQAMSFAGDALYRQCPLLNKQPVCCCRDGAAGWLLSFIELREGDFGWRDPADPYK